MAKYIIDTAPLLNILAAGEENLLIQYAVKNSAQLCVPEVVDNEAKGHFEYPLNRFKRSGAEGTWRKLRGTRIEILSEDINDPLTKLALIELRFIRPAGRMNDRKDLGEDMAMAFAVALSIQGHEVEFHLDESKARQKYEDYLAKHADRRHENQPSSRISFITTPELVQRSEVSWFTKAKTPQELMRKLAETDDGLTGKELD